MASLKIQELPEQDRPRERLTRLGAGALSDSELIAILLRTGMVGANAIDVANQLLKEYRTLGGLARCTVEELSKIKGVGPAKSVQLAAAFGLASRLAEAATLLQIRFFDHIIIGSPDNGRRPYFSFREAGVL